MIAPKIDAEILGTFVAGVVRYEWHGGSVAYISGLAISPDPYAPLRHLYLGGLALRVIDLDWQAGGFYVMRAGVAADCVAGAWRVLRAVERCYRKWLWRLVSVLPGIEIPESMIPQLGSIRRRGRG